MKLPKKPQFTYCPGLLTKQEIYYEPKDLLCGNYVYVYGRPCKIINCDDFTRKWYKENFNNDMTPIEIKTSSTQGIVHPIPQYNGFGSEEDSLYSVLYLEPKIKKKEFQYTEQFKRDKHILRFNAKLISPIPSDEERKFIVSFYVKDFSIQIYEIADRNSGRQSCKFLERKRMKNPSTGQYYEEKDMIIGNKLFLNKYTFRLLSCDEYTRKYMEDNAEIFIECDCSHIIEKIKAAGIRFSDINDYLIHLLKAIDPENKGYVTSDEVLGGLKKFDLIITEQELITLLNHLSVNDEGKYSMEDLYKIIRCYK
jgi:hypothetical protein